MWECFYSMKDEYDNQRKEKADNFSLSKGRLTRKLFR
jgi:hypothetical protein